MAQRGIVAQQCLGFFERKDYHHARIEFQKLLKRYKDSHEAADAQYYLGRCLEEKGDYYAAFKEYERWYASDLKNKTAENAKQLHTQKEGLQKRMKKLDRVIIPAGQVLEKKLLEMKILKS